MTLKNRSSFLVWGSQPWPHWGFPHSSSVCKWARCEFPWTSLYSCSMGSTLCSPPSMDISTSNTGPTIINASGYISWKIVYYLLRKFSCENAQLLGAKNKGPHHLAPDPSKSRAGASWQCPLGMWAVVWSTGQVELAMWLCPNPPDQHGDNDGSSIRSASGSTMPWQAPHTADPTETARRLIGCISASGIAFYDFFNQYNYHKHLSLYTTRFNFKWVPSINSWNCNNYFQGLKIPSPHWELIY